MNYRFTMYLFTNKERMYKIIYCNDNYEDKF